MRNNIECDNGGSIAEIFNEYFSSISIAIDTQLETSDKDPISYLPTKNSPSMFMKPLSTTQCLKVISKSKVTHQNNNSIPVT